MVRRKGRKRRKRQEEKKGKQGGITARATSRKPQTICSSGNPTLEDSHTAPKHSVCSDAAPR